MTAVHKSQDTSPLTSSTDNSSLQEKTAKQGKTQRSATEALKREAGNGKPLTGKATAQDPHGKGGTMSVHATLSSNQSGLSKIAGLGGMTQTAHPHTYTFEDPTPYYVAGKRFLAKFSVPVAKQPNAAEKEKLDAAIREWCEAFVKKANEDMPQRSPIRNARDFGVVCGEKSEDGVLIYTQDKQKGWNPERDSVADGIKSGYFKNHFKIDGEVGKALNTAISGCSAEGIRERMADADALQPYMQKSEAQGPGAASNEVGLKNLGNTCYLNAAFQQFASNKVVLDELVKNPNLFKNGKNNEFYKALLKYKQQQHTQNPKPVNLTYLLKAIGLKNSQSDINDAYAALKDQLLPDKSSLLYNCQANEGEMIGRLPVTPPRDLEAVELTDLLDNTLTAKQFTEPPKILTINVERKPGNFDKHTIPDDKLEVFVTHLLKEKSTEDFKKLLKKYGKSAPDSTSQADYQKRVELGKWLVNETQSENQYEFLQTKLLNSAEKAILYSYVPNQTKIETPVNCPLLLTLPPEKFCNGDNPTYYLMSFGCHLGEDNQGHYITYFRRNGKYFKANDSTVTTVSKDDFEKQATNALPSTILYNHESVAEQATSTSLASGDQSNTTEKPKELAGTKEEYGRFKFSAQSADTVSGYDVNKYVLVNATDASVSKQKVHPAILESDTEHEDRVLKAKTQKIAGRWLSSMRSSDSYALGIGGRMSLPEVLVTEGDDNLHEVYHVGGPEELTPLAIERAVKASIIEARKQKQQKKIVFLVPKTTGSLNEQEALDACKKAVQEFAANNTKAVEGIEVVALFNKEQGKTISAKATLKAASEPKNKNEARNTKQAPKTIPKLTHEQRKSELKKLKKAENTLSKIESTKSQSKYLDKIRNGKNGANFAPLYHIELPGVTVMTANTLKHKADHGRLLDKKPDITKIEWEKILRGDVIDCRPGEDPTNSPEGVTHLDLRAFGDGETLLRVLAEKRKTGGFPKEIKVILPHFDPRNAASLRSSPQNNQYRLTRLWNTITTVTSKLTTQTDSRPERADFTSGWTDEVGS